jgi:hypothetical protein
MTKGRAKQARRKRAVPAMKKQKSKVQSRSRFHPEAVIHQDVLGK